jgi:CHAT domain-containing protein
MVQFYYYLDAGQHPATALKNAQTWLRNASRETLLAWLGEAIPKLAAKVPLQRRLKTERDRLISLTDSQPYSHPYYWAAFTIAGL